MKIFQDLGPDEMRQLEQALTMVNCPPGRLFYVPEETGEVLFLLKKGRVQLYRLSPDGRKLTVKILEPMTFFGEMAILGQGMYDTFAEAMEDCLLCVMSRRDVQSLLLSKPTVALRLCQEMANRLMETERQLEGFVFKGVLPRLAGLLLHLAGEGDEVVGYSHQALAELLGVYRETATHTLDELKSLGLVEISRKRIRLLDRRALADISRQ
ncbi:MAG: Crp/Fnr family transcriptional regulator [Acidobacteria bacterium]|nr:Crp/Fnr family transcriptional regulator [Acidobacteriota bacterium]